MSGSTDWPIRTLPITKLQLDPQNVRLRHDVSDQDEILAHLFEHEDVLSLLRDIARDGYFDNEQPMVVEEDGQTIVVEGNRRVSSLKALARPDRVPAFAQRIRAAAARADDPTFPKRIRVMVAPSRSAALQVIARLHTRNPKKSWIREQQARFYYDRLLEGQTLQDLREEFPAEDSIRDFVVAGQMMERLRAAVAEVPELADFVDSAKFKLTNYEYLYDTTTFRTKVGLVIDDGIVSAPNRTGDFLKKLFQQVAIDLKSGKITTRTVRVSSDAFTDYVSQLVSGAEDSSAEQDAHDYEGATQATSPEPLPQVSTDGTTASSPRHPDNDATSMTATEESLPDDKAPSARPASKQRHDRKLDVRGIKLGLTSAGIRVRWDELCAISVRTLPNATFDILRTFIECIIKEYFVAAGNPVTNPNPKSPVQMRQCLDHLEKNLGHERVVRDGLVRLKSRQTSDLDAYYSSAAALNDSNHEPNAIFNSEQVNLLWAQVKPLVQFLVSGPVEVDPVD
ncbi:hypothetical protein NYQ31_03170 [Curtobacterium flaccumfaciens]|uniref:hypothetical protein n=1 Tax=Curtobacterium flaccumfaciens TaxID=2035 RepID=UPI00217E1631|nr:hypothetical protein [Curtobacterium flaccumfaciens]MCS6557391.1 hypothetical protein [Curtobacterium flaccumfaciens]